MTGPRAPAVWVTHRTRRRRNAMNSAMFPFRSLCEAFQQRVAADADRIALRTPDDTVTITWGEYAARVRAIAAGLAALGVRRGDSVGLMMVNRPEFALC